MADFDGINLPGNSDGAPVLTFDNCPAGLGRNRESGSIRLINNMTGLEIQENVVRALPFTRIELSNSGLLLSAYGGTYVVPAWVGDSPPQAPTVGSDVAFADGTIFIGELFVPYTMTFNGIAFLVGSVGGTDRVVGWVWDAVGVACEETTQEDGGVVVGTTGTLQQIPFRLGPGLLNGPMRYFIGLAANGNTAKFRALSLGVHRTGSISATHGTQPTLHPDTDVPQFVADKGPYAALY